MPTCLENIFSSTDPEEALRGHRWAGCLVAIGHPGKARDAFHQAMEWIAAPPPRESPAWETYSCCERIANLALLLAAQPELLAEAYLQRLAKFFSETATWIDEHLEYYGLDRTNNHFLNNGRALVIAGVVTGNDAWIRAGMSIANRFAPILFSVNGCLREGSSHYQMVVAGWLFDLLAFARLASPGLVTNELEALAEQVGTVCAKLAECIPAMDTHIGDISPDLHPVQSLARLRLLYPERLNCSASSGRYGQWLIASDGPGSLLTRAESSWPCAFTTHAHSDLGSFVWLWNGEPILVDPGRESYQAVLSGGLDQVAAASHNTLMVDGIPPLAASVLTIGAWYPRPYADASIDSEVEGSRIRVGHDGFRRIAGLGTHVREVILAGNEILVTDILEGRGEARIDLNWHFSPRFREESDTSLTSETGRISIEIDFPVPGVRRWREYTYSRSYGQRESARSLVHSMQVSLPCRLQTRMHYMPCAG